MADVVFRMELASVQADALDACAFGESWIRRAVTRWVSSSEDGYPTARTLPADAAANLIALRDVGGKAPMDAWIALAAEAGWDAERACGSVLREPAYRIRQRIRRGQAILDDPQRAPKILARILPVPLLTDPDWLAPDAVTVVEVTLPGTLAQQMMDRCGRLGWPVQRGFRQAVTDSLFLSGATLTLCGGWPSPAAQAVAGVSAAGVWSAEHYPDPAAL